ncbi:hypothetical protein [uncultured Sphingomonas sp.]|uniref:hypothetical protein n=1 Tax=uncultured Sphingomonas sp. TaxID=158754 RepID=UPI0025D8804D|nr:hypothetical protein [uncultured Sphingomonas sp.]
MGLVALDEAAERARAARGPVDTCLSDRVVLAMLYAIAGRDRSSFYGFWRELRRPIGPLTGDATMRGNMLHTHFCGICRALGIKQTIAFTSALGAARREPIHGFRDPEPFPADEQRARFAEFLRETMNDERYADLALRRVRILKARGARERG